MPPELVLPLESCRDPLLVGGKAAGLENLIRKGFRVPPGICVTAQAYRDCLSAAGFNQDEEWSRLGQAPEPERQAMAQRWTGLLAALPLPSHLLTLIQQELDRQGISPVSPLAVRSSASDEDGVEASFAGIYRTRLGVSRGSLAAAILDCWTSLWSPEALAYRNRIGAGRRIPAMAVIVQPLLNPRVAGICHSRHPVTGEDRQVLINAVFGLGEPLASGLVTPDQYLVELESHGSAGKVIERRIAHKTSVAALTDTGLTYRPLSEADGERSTLNDGEALELAGLAKRVEQLLGGTAEVEWAIDEQGIWLLQARRIPAARTAGRQDLVWSRANFKETMPEVPSPLGLSFLEEFMESGIVRHYRELGCLVPPGWCSTRILRGRPYINVTLFQSFMVQLGADPDQIAEQMGGVSRPPPAHPPRLPLWTRLTAALVMERKIRRAAKRAPGWFAEMKRVGVGGAPLAGSPPTLLGEVQRAGRRQDAPQTPAEIMARLEGLLQAGDLTLAIVAGVSQGLYLLGRLLEWRMGSGWRPLFNRTLLGQGTIISAKQILWLTELAETARRESAVQAFFLEDPWTPAAYRSRLAGTVFLAGFDAYLDEYGHRAIGESDPMSPRFAEMPDYPLTVIRGHLLAPDSASQKAAAIRHGQQIDGEEALRLVRRAFGWRRHELALFNWGHRRLCRFLALREANRHHLMYFTSAARQLLLELGATLVAQGCLLRADDIFFLTTAEIRSLKTDPMRDWKPLTQARREERRQNETLEAPDTVIEGRTGLAPSSSGPGDILKGMAISAGYAEGPARLVKSPMDLMKVRRGDIVVAPVIDPGMAPVLGLAGGLVVEMGGTLSHGAIIAREYGLPAVANVPDVMRLVRDGERLGVDASLGEIRRLAGRPDAPS